MQIDTSAVVVNQRSWNVTSAFSSFVAYGVSVSRPPGFTNIDAFRFYVNNYNQFTVGFNYFKQATAWSLDMETFTTLTVFSALNSDFAFFFRPYSIIEYDDDNGIPGLQSNDTILSVYPLSRSPTNWYWLYISITYGLISETAYVGTWHTQDSVFAFQVFLVPRPFIVDGLSVNQDSVKVAVQINYSNYANASASNTSKIALVLLTGAAEMQTLPPGNGNESSVNIPSSVPPYLGGFVNFTQYVNITRPDNTTAWEAIDIQWEANWTDVNNIQGQYQAGYVVSALFLTLGGHDGRVGSVWWDPTIGANINYVDTPSTLPTPGLSPSPPNSSSKSYASIGYNISLNAIFLSTLIVLFLIF